MKTEFQTLLVSRLKLVFDSWKRKRNEKNFVLVDFVRQQAESSFGCRQKERKTTAKLEKSVENPNFQRFDNFQTRQKTNQLLELKTKEKMLEIIDLRTQKLKFYSLICDSFVRLKKRRKENKIKRQLLRFSVGKIGLTDDKIVLFGVKTHLTAEIKATE